MGKAPKTSALSNSRNTSTLSASGATKRDGAMVMGDKNSAKRTTVFTMNKGFGQHMLKNPLVAQGIVDKSDIKPSDIVLEVGPGTGNLTVRILEQARKLYCVEMDPRMASELTKRVQGHPEWQRKLEIMLGDVIKTDIPYHDILISNTPYQISAPLVEKFLALPRPPRQAVLMFQREFALRLLARPGDSLYCRLSVNVQMWATVTHIMKVGRNNFRPPPQVESSVVRIVPKNPRPDLDYNEWNGLLHICFGRKNKTLAAGFKNSSTIATLEANYKTFLSMKNADAMDVEMEEGDSKKDLKEVIKSKIEQVFETTGLGSKRPAKCTEKDFLTVLHAFHQVGLHFA